MFMQVTNLGKTYGRGDQAVDALKDVSFTLERGQFVSIMGPSGSGKSTFLQICGGLDRPTRGSVEINGESIASYSDLRLSEFRRRKLGFIFQSFNLLPSLDATENVALPLLLDRKSMKDVTPKAKKLLELVGLSHRLHHKPNEMSGGEMQRVAIARALIADPLLILADEPTGNLDSKTGTFILELLAHLVSDQKQTVLLVTHDLKAASYGSRLISFRDGHIESDGRPIRV